MHEGAILLYMDAESSFFVEAEPARIRDQLAAVFAAFEQSTGLQICFRPLSERWGTGGVSIVPAPFNLHRSPFCRAVKAQADPACVKSDLTDLPKDCSSPRGPADEPFIRACHAGAEEVLLPLRSDGVLVAVLFLGQFTRMTRDRQGAAPVVLRHLDETDAERLRDLVLPLKSYLLDVLRTLDRQREKPAAGRMAIVHDYIRASLSSGPTLAGLASRLALSPSRAGHVVRELTGHSFQQLVEERRIAVAKDLLASSDGTIAWIARQTGLGDSAYFCRYFKRKTGSTPSNFRNRQPRNVSV
jgi:AraC-like DNA-binding protein